MYTSPEYIDRHSADLVDRETEKNDPWEILSSFSDILFSFNSFPTRPISHIFQRFRAVEIIRP